VGGKLGDRVFELVTRHRRRGEIGHVLLEHIGFIGIGAGSRVTRGDGPFGRQLRFGHELDELQRGLALLGAGVFENVEIAAAGGGAQPLGGGQHAHAEVEFCAVTDRGEVARGMPHHGRGALEELLPQRAPVDGPLGHHLVLHGQVTPELHGLDHRRLVEVSPVAVLVHQFLTVLDAQRLEHPVGIARGGDVEAPAGHVARGVLLGQFLGHGDHLVPGRRRLVRVQPHFLEGVLVVVHHDRGALERDSPGLALGLGVRHQGRVKGGEPLLVFRGGGEIIEGDDDALIDQLENIDGEEHAELDRLVRLERGQRLHAGVVIVAGVDGLDLDVGVGFLEIGDHVVDDLGDRPADGHRVIHVKVDGRLGRGDAQQQNCQTAQHQDPSGKKSFH